jgi:hypothetical protein
LENKWSKGHLLLDSISFNRRGYESPVNKSFGALEQLLDIQATVPIDLFQVSVACQIRITTIPNLYIPSPCSKEAIIMGASGVSCVQCVFQCDVKGSRSWGHQRGSIAYGRHGDEVLDR